MWTPNFLLSFSMVFVKAAEYRSDGVPEALLRELRRTTGKNASHVTRHPGTDRRTLRRSPIRPRVLNRV
jgi:hypothetical protein